MSAPLRQQRLAALRDTIADIERKPALAEARTVVADAGEGFPKFAGGLLQEIFTDERRNAGASLGFALGQARGLLSERRRAVIYLQLSADAQEMGVPYGPGLVTFGFDPAALVLVRPATMVELLWAAEEAIACRAVSAVIADIAGAPKLLDFTASRRLSLRAASAGTSVFMLRYGTARQASAAQLRWRLQPAMSAEVAFDPRAPGASRWRLRQEKGALSTTENQEWLLAWTDHGFAPFDLRRRRERQPGTAPLSRPLFTQLGDRLLQAG